MGNDVLIHVNIILQTSHLKPSNKAKIKQDKNIEKKFKTSNQSFCTYLNDAKI